MLPDGQVARGFMLSEFRAADTTIRVYDGDQLIAEVPRTTTKPIARFKAREPEPPRRQHDPTVRP